MEDYLDARVLLMPRYIAASLPWGIEAGWKENTLFMEANRRWQVNRQKMLEQGKTLEEIRVDLIDMYEKWLNMPQDKLDDKTPLEIIQEERVERQEDDDEEE